MSVINFPISSSVSNADFSPSKAAIHEISSLSELFQYIRCFKDPMIIFDIDRTLITYKDAILYNGVNKFIGELQKEYELSDEQKDNLMSIILRDAQYKLMEENVLHVLGNLSNNPNVFALTMCRTGKFGVIDNVERWKNELLRKHGINFNNFTDFNGTIFYELISGKKNIF